MSRLLILSVTLLTALAGCIQPPQDSNDLVDTQRDGRNGGSMTASETKSETAALCQENLLGGNGKFCATRTITIEGTLTGFSALDVALETFNGDITIAEGPNGKWGAVITLEARGDSASAATARLSEIDLTWAHEDATGHFVDIAAKHEGESNDLEATLELALPREVIMTIVAATSNGDIELAGGRTNGLALTTSNGDVTAKADVTQTSLTTSNGDVEASLTPAGDARWALTTSNGDVTLQVPEGDAYGYSFEGTTSNGEVDYAMRDGEKGPCPQGSEYYTPPCNHRTFETHGYGGRQHQVRGALTTSNGDVDAASQ